VKVKKLLILVSFVWYLHFERYVLTYKNTVWNNSLWRKNLIYFALFFGKPWNIEIKVHLQSLFRVNVSKYFLQYIALQCCVGFYSTLKIIRHTYTYILSLWISLALRTSQWIRETSLCYTEYSQQLSILYIVSLVCMCQSQYSNSSHPNPFPLGTMHLVSISLSSFLLCK